MTEINIPEAVTVIGDHAFRNCSALGTVGLKEGLTTIYAYSFEGCTSLEEIKLPDSITTMGYMVFLNDTALTTVNYPKNYTTSINEHGASSGQRGSLFSGCTSLETVSIPEGTETIASYAFQNSSITHIEIPESVTSIGAYAFDGCTKLTEINIPEAVTVIGDHAFRNCSALGTVGLKEGLTTIYAYSFEGCTSLEEIKLPDSITTMGYMVFRNDTALTTVNYPKNYTTSINEHGASSGQRGSLFSGCTSLETVSIPEGTETIASYVFQNSSITHIEIPESVTSIGAYAFDGCTKLTEINIPEAVTVIGDHAFRNCSALGTVGLKEGLTTIYAYSFEGCTSLEEIKLPDSITTMGYMVFLNDTALTTVNYPKNYTTSINEHGASSGQRGSLFYGCTSLETVSIPEGTETIASYAFQNSSITHIEIPASTTGIGAFAFADCGGLEDIQISEGVLTLGESAFSKCTALKTLILPDSITSIGKNALSGCTALASVNYPLSLTSAGTGIFSGDALLKQITVPEGVKTLPDNVFNGANYLIRVNLPESLEKVGASVFSGAVGLKKIILPSSVTSIGNTAFASMTALTDIWIGEKVTSIGNNVFRGCDLQKLTIHGVAGSYAQTYANTNSIAFSEDPVVYDETKLYGHVLDQTGNGVSDVTVTVYDVHSAAVIFDCVTDEDGYWSYELGYPGDVYSITASHTDYDMTPAEIRVTVSEDNEMDTGSFVAVPNGQQSTSETLFTYSKLNGGYLAITGYSGEETNVVIPEKINGNKVTVIAENAFADNAAITSVRIPDTVTQIQKNAFKNCTALETIKFPGRLISIGESAFEGCSALKKAELPNTVVTLAQYAFRNCIELTEFSYPLSLTTVGAGVFSGDVKLEEITVPDAVKTIPENMFSGASELKRINIPETLVTIGKNAFLNCSGLTELDLPDSVQTIGDYAFKGCSELSVINYPLSLTSAGTGMFTDDVKLVQITVPEGATILPQNVFRDAKSLQKVVLPSTLEKISAYAFYNCNSLAEVNVPDSVSEIGNYAFQNCTSLSEFNYPSALVTAGTGIFNGDTGIAIMTVPEGVEALPDNVFSGDMKTAFFELPSTLLTVGKKAFAGEKELSRLVLPDSVTAINDQAFQNCTNLTDIWIGENVTTISSNAFDGCSTDTLVIHGIAGSHAQSFAQEKGFTFSEERFSDKPRTIRGSIINKTDERDSVSSSDQAEGLEGINVEILDAETRNVIASTTTDENGVWTYNTAKAGKTYVISTVNSEMYTETLTLEVSVGEDDVTETEPIVGIKITAAWDNRYVTFGWAPVGTVSTTEAIYETLRNAEFNEDGITVIDGTRYKKDGSKYKKMAPIVWRILSDNSDGTYTLMSETTMATSAFGSDNWVNSTIRSYLNEDFYKQSFLKEEREHIEYRYLSSRTVGATYLDSHAFSYDKVYILSADEYSASRFGFYSPDTKDLRRAATHEIYETGGVTTPAYGDVSADGKRWFSWTRDVPKKSYGFAMPAYVTCDGQVTHGTGAILDNAHVYYTWVLALRPVINVWKYSEYLGVNENYDDVQEYNGTFAFLSKEQDSRTEVCHYKDSYFEEGSWAYNHELAKMSLALEMSAFNSAEGTFFDVADSYYNDSANMTTTVYDDQAALLSSSKAKNVIELMRKCGFKDIGVNADYLNSVDYDGVKNVGNNIGVCIGHKEINGQTLIAVALRGAGYGCEWIGNFEVYESGTNHRGFEIARNKVVKALNDYAKMYQIGENMKLWIVGYSRAAATANLTAAYLADNGINGCNIPSQNIYAYTFETPMGTRDPNSTAYNYKGIHNIINPIDFVPKVAFDGWGYRHYGTNVFLPSQYFNEKVYSHYEPDVVRKVNLLLGEQYDSLPHIKNQELEVKQFLDGVTSMFPSDDLEGVNTIQKHLQAIWKNTQGDAESTGIFIRELLAVFGAGGLAFTLAPGKALSLAMKGYDTAMTLAFAHFPELEFAWMNAIPTEDMSLNGYIRYDLINCPVDIAVYDDNNVLQLRFIDNEIVYEEGSYIEASVDSDGQKIICVPSDVSIHLELIGTDSGTLNYSVQEYSLAENKVTSIKNYYDLPLEKGTQYTATMSDITERQYNIYDENNNQITPYEELNGSEIEQYKVTVTAEGNGTVSGTSMKLKGEFTEAVAEPDENAAFLGWYDSNGNLVSSESDYRFRVTGNTDLTGRFETPLVSAEFADEEIILVKGESQELKPVLTPYNADIVSMQWESSDPDYVTVDSNGVLKGIEEGTSTITLNVNNGAFVIQCMATVVTGGIYIKNLKAPYTYTGTAIKPEISVYDSGTLLKPKTDYTVTYKNTAKAYTLKEDDPGFDAKKAPQIIIKSNSKGNYKGSKTVYFTIEPVDLMDDSISVDELSAQAGSKPISPVPVVYFNGKKLKAKTDYTVNYGDWDHLTPGDVTITIEGIGNFQGTRNVKMHVASSDLISVAKLKVTSKPLKYTDLSGDDFEEDVEWAITVKNGKQTVYSYEYYFEDIPEDYKKAGTLKFTLVGREEEGYYGKKTVTIKIAGIALTDKKVKPASGLSYPYTGEEVTFTPETSLAVYDGIDLIEGTDYVIDSYTKNLNAGTGTVTLKGINNYTGTKKVNFKIIPVVYADYEEEFDIDVKDTVYSKGGAIPEVHIFWKDNELKAGTDYTLKYANNKKVTDEFVSKWPTVTITFKGNYKGTVRRDFFIDPKPLDLVTITAKDKVYSAKANAWKSAPVLKDTDGKTLKAGTDYEKTITYSTEEDEELPEVVNAGTVVKVTVTGKGSYTGTVSTTYRILNTGCDISKATFKIENQEYTGKEILITDMSQFTGIEGLRDAYVKVDGEELYLELGKDFEVVPGSYVKNINKGTAKVTFRGIGDYGGTKTVSFKIGQRSIVDYWQGVKNFFSKLF